uniref:DUF7950 domain-containing protein n=1 Tax=Opuntia streptacantha TaxID=393608 RepID=A0A7C9CLE7_OPUST
MDGRGGCCIARYAAAAGHAYDMSQVDRIMLKFRPIAPKPAAGGAAPAASDGGSDGHAKAPPGGGGRGRRKSCSKDTSNNSGCNSTRRCTNGRKRKSSSPDQTAVTRPDHHQLQHQHLDQKAVTLPLLPEAPDLSPTKQPHKMPFWLSFNSTPGVQDNYAQSRCKVGPGTDPTVMIPPPQHHQNHHHHLQHQPVVRSCVVVEAVTDTCPPEGVRVGDVRALEKDTCPVIISDGWNMVVWGNEAYRRMVLGDTWRDRRMTVSVEMRERVPERVQAFTCRVRVERTNDGRESRGSSSLTLPCDVWRIDGGGFAWRLDVDAALSLGLGR